MKTAKTTVWRIAVPLVAALLLPRAALAQMPPPGQQPYPPQQAPQSQPTFSQAQLDQMLAPVALYPDQLLSQMFMAATYPLEVVEAARWSQANPNLQGDAAVQAVAGQNWDPSVKSLVAFPQVLGWMDQNLEWTQSVGDAFLAQQGQVMATVQNLRTRAQTAGTLRSDDRQTVVDQNGAILVQPANPQVVYVPYYDPFVVYGAWWWPAFPPVVWRPWPRYVVHPGIAISWAPGIHVSAGFFFGDFDWRRHQTRVVRVNNFYYNNTTVVHNDVRRDNVPRDFHPAPVVRAPGAWQHDPDHRRGVAYRAPEVQRQFGAQNQRREEERRAAPRPEMRDDREHHSDARPMPRYTPQAQHSFEAPQPFQAQRQVQAQRQFDAPRPVQAQQQVQAPHQFETPRQFQVQAPRQFEAPRQVQAQRQFEAPRQVQAPRQFQAPHQFAAHHDFERSMPRGQHERRPA
jgi:hypothetical protein